jgi:hypothetical protein
MSIFALFIAASHTLAIAPAHEARLYSAADALSIAVDVAEAIPDPVWPEELELAIEQAWDEGRWRASPRGDNDKGSACGVTQINRFVIPEGYGTCAELRASRVVAIRAWHALMVEAIARCGSVRSGYGAVMSRGACGSVPKLVAYRCGRSGAC